MIACFAATFLAGLMLAGPLFGAGIRDIISSISDMTSDKTIMLLKFFQVIQAIGLFIIPALLAGYFFERSSISYFRLDHFSTWQVYFAALVLVFAAQPFINWMVTVNEAVRLPEFMRSLENWMQDTEAEASRLTDAFMLMPTLGGFLFNMLMIALLPAIGEEFMFRGLLQRLFREWLGSIHVAILVSAFLFSAMHLQFYGFLARMMLGIMFGYLLYWSGSIWVPVCAHFINNGAAVIFSYLGQTGALKGDYEDFGNTDNVFLIILSAMAVSALMFFIYRLKPAQQRE